MASATMTLFPPKRDESELHEMLRRTQRKMALDYERNLMRPVRQNTRIHVDPDGTVYDLERGGILGVAYESMDYPLAPISRIDSIPFPTYPQRFDADDKKWVESDWMDMSLHPAHPEMHNGDVLVVSPTGDWRMITNLGDSNVANVTDRESIRLTVSIEFDVRLPVDASYSGTISEEERVTFERNYVRGQVDWLYKNIAGAVNDVTQKSRGVLESYGADVRPADNQADMETEGEYDYDVRITRR